MTDYTDYPNGDPVKRASGSNAASTPTMDTYENTFEAVRLNMVATDTVTVLTIPANSWVFGVFLEIIDVQATGTVDLGDAADPNGWVADGSIATATTLKGAGAYAVGKFYTAETDLLFTVPTAKVLTTAKLRVVALIGNTG